MKLRGLEEDVPGSGSRRGEATLWSWGRNVRDGEEVADRIGEATTQGGRQGEEGRRRAINNARNYNQRGAEGRFACLPWTITEFWC